MAALLVSIGVMSVMLSMAMPVWNHYVQREKEAELVWRGQQYARAIGLYQRRFGGTFPPSVDVLVEQRFLRRAYKDPITGEDFQLLGPASAPGQPGQAGPPGQAGQPGQQGQFRQPGLSMPTRPFSAAAGQGPPGGIMGVTSRSTERSIRIYNGAQRYNEWRFVYTDATQAPQAPGQQQPALSPGLTRPPGMQPGGVGPGQPGAGPRPQGAPAGQPLSPGSRVPPG